MRRVRYVVRINRIQTATGALQSRIWPGCVATGKTIDAALRRSQGAMVLHLRGMKGDAVRRPRPRQRTVAPRQTKRQVDFYASVEVAT